MRCLLFLFFPLISFTQQDPLSGMFWNNYAHINPASSGMEFKHEAYATYRAQWTKINGSPSTLFANYNTRMGEHHGLGVNYYYETIGFTVKQQANLNYNYQFLLQEDRKIALGAALGFDHLGYDPLLLPSTADPLPQAANNTFIPNINLGVTYISGHIYSGLGFSNIDPLRNEPYFNKSMHTHFNFRYHFDLTQNQKFKLFAEMLLRTDWVRLSADFNTRLLAFNQMWFGLSYRTSNIIGGNVMWDIKKKFRVGYMAEFNLGSLGNSFGSSHEFVLGLRLE